ncbi:MAG: hypothetical protein ACRD3V_04935 [Vicinamibacteria bacterium]
MSSFRWALVIQLLGAGCTTYEYEEEVFLEVDGSGSIRMSGSQAAVQAVHDVEPSGALLEGAGVEVLSVRETEREGRTFLHVQGRFASFRDLCRAPAFRGRRCLLEKSEDELRLELEVPSPPFEALDGVDSQGVLALRYHFPSTIRFHNSPGGIERGNILSWRRPIREHFGGKPLSIEALFDRRTILEASLRILALAIGVVVASVATALWVMVRKGRREPRLGRLSDGSPASRARQPPLRG